MPSTSGTNGSLVELPNEERTVDSELVPSSSAAVVPIPRSANEIEEENPKVDSPCRLDAPREISETDLSKQGVGQFNTDPLQRLEPDNILPLSVKSHKPAIMEIPEIKAAINALRQVKNLPIPIISPTPATSSQGSSTSKDIKNVNEDYDIFDWLSAVFGFQKGNAANQREHLILLLANIDLRTNPAAGSHDELREGTVQQLKNKIFENYNSWCDYVGDKSNIKKVDLDHEQQQKDVDLDHKQQQQQRDLIYIAMYLLIWGEASNVRFMPECICYIFHKMSDDFNKKLSSNENHVAPDEAFLKDVITPIYNVLADEAKRSKKGKASHSNWRNYDDLNEYFWSNRCFKLGWPMDLKADFSRDLVEKESANQCSCGDKTDKTNFVEIRTFLHLYTSFDRMWIFLILALQTMIIIAWRDLGPLAIFSNKDILRTVMSIFVTYAVLNFLRASLDIALIWKARKNMKCSQFVRYIAKFITAAIWVVVLPISYSRFLPKTYICVVASYLSSNIVVAILFFLPCLEYSYPKIISCLMWWYQPSMYIGRGMRDNIQSILKYSLFWTVLLISKLAFSYYVEIRPLVRPTKLIMDMPMNNYQLWHAAKSGDTEAIKPWIVITIWAPIISVYFMDVQIWYAIFSSVLGWIIGAFNGLGEMRTFEMLHSRSESVRSAFSRCFLSESDKCETENSV